ncbi:hypothetical protein PoB_000084500 [Plakobranchus ocellatus]|uniref:Uncharacterized protein n=1 Tax=Plakobranchus ocellatus TaxID=259542 RepID=A0AAV3XUK3_9GAST|nr:hypothetical protein PoB_000084500 [Plakobranchus ocellatus]
MSAVNGQCDPVSVYNYGTCRPRACPDTETFLPGISYCDAYARVLGIGMARCVTNLPCCVWGGQCRQFCNADERQLNFQSDCSSAGSGVCCVNSGQTRVAPQPSGPQPLPLPPPEINIAQRQGRKSLSPDICR